MAIDHLMPVLVVDDSPTTVRVVRNLLWQLGFTNIDDANNAITALTKMRAKRYGLVISDWNMNSMTGYDFLREVRADPTLHRTPFIMVTADVKTQSVIAAKRAGVNSYIIKPFDALRLKSKIELAFAAVGNSSDSCVPPTGASPGVSI